MRRGLGGLLGGVVLALLAMVAGAGGAAAAGPAVAVTPAPTPTCPPALPLSGGVSAATSRSLTISYSIFFAPPCGYNPPVVVTLFASAEDARQWLNPVAEAVSGLERNGRVTIDGLAPDTTYWFRFSADGKHDPYAVGSGRTAAVEVCAASVAVGSAWNGGYVATVTVRNTGVETLDSWRVSWSWSGDESIVSLWNAVREDVAGGVVAGNASYNGVVAPGGSTTFGLLVASSSPPAGLTPSCTR
ncbi:cellulose binding domain-containing protein [Actinoplanes sp. Pm04-4]|uniref:Cellulose binding domain-containing protein n=1 Tax=Paractinoplanes pyxinae TaxID=2997416 RepID=A0ABT4BAU6_9ACTN|nr:cellulose binding domain-containing protein [Actinoplanes pyxinae]MCY1143647.1 cellulose binding domain-containing protein [Actinoplanes pyxinae]